MRRKHMNAVLRHNDPSYTRLAFLIALFWVGGIAAMQTVFADSAPNNTQRGETKCCVSPPIEVVTLSGTKAYKGGPVVSVYDYVPRPNDWIMRNRLSSSRLLRIENLENRRVLNAALGDEWSPQDAGGAIYASNSTLIQNVGHTPHDPAAPSHLEGESIAMTAAAAEMPMEHGSHVNHLEGMPNFVEHPTHVISESGRWSQIAALENV
ncbi:hypothetical protein, partial [Candidatus Laterigemmans baculatus]|uniref:hypothetical protein n=1 Tax=Candidatus Laterigemmans baculatus TaxID=2770505 RepID=UPI0013DB70E0